MVSEWLLGAALIALIFGIAFSIVPWIFGMIYEAIVLLWEHIEYHDLGKR